MPLDFVTYSSPIHLRAGLSSDRPTSPDDVSQWWSDTDTVNVYKATLKSGVGLAWELVDSGGGGASELSDLTDVNTSTPTNRNVLVADGVDWESRSLTEADISDLGSYITADSTDTLTNKTFDANGTGNSLSNVDLANDVIGNLPVTNLNSGTSAGATTFWRGDGTWATPAGSGANELSDLTDVNTSTPTNKNVLVADGVDWESRALTEADISDLGSYITADSTDTLTNKTFDANGTGNSVSNIDLTADVINDLPITEGGTGASDASTARTNLGLAIGSDVQAYDAHLDDIAGIAPVKGDMIYFDGTNWIDIPIGSDNQILKVNIDVPNWEAESAGGASELSDLTDVNTSTPTNRNVLVADGVDWESRALTEADISDLGTYLETVDLTSDVTGILPIANGGTAASSAASARTNLDVQQDLSGLSLTAVTVAGTDKVLIQDTGDSDNLKTVTAQSIADLGGGGSYLGFPTTISADKTVDAGYSIVTSPFNITAGDLTVEGTLRIV